MDTSQKPISLTMSPASVINFGTRFNGKGDFMARYRKFIWVIVIVFSSVLGGALSNIWLQYNASASISERDIVGKSIRLVDSAGVTRAGLIFENGLPVFFINDKNQKNRVALGVGNRGPLLAFKGPDGSLKLFLDSGNDGSSIIGLASGKKQQRVLISFDPKRGPAIGLFDENNVGKAVISVTHGDPSVTLADRDKKPGIAMFIKKGEGSILSIWNNHNDPAVALSVHGDKPGLFMYQQPRTGLLFNLAGGAPALALMDHGSPIWTATGATPPALDLPPMDDMMRELTR